jgi:eukaryotic-like serine/threonine-protein kinase
VYRGLELVGRYVLEERLGRGGMGEVWQALDVRLHRPVAVKLLPVQSGTDPGLAARFRREAEITAALVHPGITVLFDIDEEDQLLFLVMELLTGEDLSKVLSRSPHGLPVGQVVSIARQIVEGLAVAHERGVVHRDIKPANLMLLDSGTVKICDFGIARFADATSNLTGTGSTIGTAAYMAPEQLEGHAVDGRTDLYALGCVLHALITGQPPFPTDRGVGMLLHYHLTQIPESLRTARPDLPPTLDRLILDLLAKSPDERPANAAAVLARLGSLGETPVEPPPPPPSPPPPPPTPVVPTSVRDQRYTEAKALYDSHDLPNALRLARRLAAEQGQVLGPDHTDTLATRNLVAWSLHGLGRYDEALALAGPLAQARTAQLGPHDRATLDTYSLVSGTLYALHRFEECLPVAGEVAGNRYRLLGPWHRATLTSQNLVGWCLHKTGRDAEALPLAEGTARARAQVLGPQHLDTLDSRTLTGWCLHGLRRHDQALKAAAQLTQTLSHIAGHQHVATLSARNLEAWSLYSLDRHRKALPMAREVYADRRRVLGTTHRDTLDSGNLVAGILYAQSQYHEALSVAQETAAARAHVLGPTHRASLSSAYLVASCLHRLERDSEARHVLQQLGSARDVLGAEHPLVARIERLQATLLGR